MIIKPPKPGLGFGILGFGILGFGLAWLGCGNMVFFYFLMPAFGRGRLDQLYFLEYFIKVFPGPSTWQVINQIKGLATFLLKFKSCKYYLGLTI